MALELSVRKKAKHIKKVVREAEVQSTKPFGGKHRPRLEDIVVLTEEMEHYARELRAGFKPEEIAERMDIPVSRALRLAENDAILQRVKVLYGNKLEMWSLMRDELYEGCLNAALRLVHGNANFEDIKWLIERLERQADIEHEPEKETRRVRQEVTYNDDNLPVPVEPSDLPQGLFTPKPAKQVTTVEETTTKPKSKKTAKGE